MRCENVLFRYPGESFALRLPALAIDSGEALGIVGPSGCGKTTLLRLIAGILQPAAGRIEVAGECVSGLAFAARQRFRIARIGLVFQEFELLDYLDVLDNVLLPYRIASVLEMDDAARGRAEALLESTGVSALRNRFPGELSQGERQRVALCRALVTRPGVILADEPTGSLDPENQARGISLMRESAAAAGATLVMVTHDHDSLDGFDRVVALPEILDRSEN
ncbi:MAG: ABC transporter ATP-binding protein [Verrucomicrobiae bacterium]|nr:ABC transporter ATP-binding protein [Verrucomicrobiae bacterium]MCP5539608.1 ABC transporter ATP-binding protein [Akkermansiaceae bacterium]MCP5549346.1 ABC transporter ATP-binding protein [Akkermansiaceae bacterium]